MPASIVGSSATADLPIEAHGVGDFERHAEVEADRHAGHAGPAQLALAGDRGLPGGPALDGPVLGLGRGRLGPVDRAAQGWVVTDRCMGLEAQAEACCRVTSAMRVLCRAHYNLCGMSVTLMSLKSIAIIVAVMAAWTTI